METQSWGVQTDDDDPVQLPNPSAPHDNDPNQSPYNQVPTEHEHWADDIKHSYP